MTRTRSLVDTKLYAPRPRPGLIARPELTKRLDRGMPSRLTLVSAPAGFGKTTLLVEWLASPKDVDHAVAWLSIDEDDDEPTVFWTYVISALQRAIPGVGGGALSLLHAGQPPAIGDILAALLNELGAVPNDVVLVLDDYHAVTSPEIQAGMRYLVEHLPAHVHLVLATRADPALPLSRLRARGELVEIRATDLRFTPEATGAYLNDVMGLSLQGEEVAALEARTEGWISAIQLAGLSLQGRTDTAGFIASFAGDDRYIVDYLVEEVLQRQPLDVRSFLLQTSILDRLTGGLCDAVTGQKDGKAKLEALDRANLFLVPLDDRRQWYRYHHLFADVLQARLRDEQADRVPALHRRASDWYERHGERSHAISHALAGEDFERAADLVELALPALREARAIATMRAWLQALPDELFLARPVLNVTYAGSLMADGEVADVETRLRDAERWLDLAPTAEGNPGDEVARRVVVDEGAFRRLPATIAIYRAAQAQGAGDVARVLVQAQRALDVSGANDHFERGAAAGFLALAHWHRGQLETAYGHWADTMASLEAAGHAVDALGCIRPLAEIRIAQGRLRDAMRLYERGLALGTRHGTPVLRGTADMHVGMSGVLIEWDDLDAARAHLGTSTALGDNAGMALNPYRWYVAMARIREIDGDFDGAHQMLDEAERVYVGEFYPDVRPVAALKARLAIVQGRLDEATKWVSHRGLAVDDELSYLREFEHLVLARLLMARGQREPDHSSTRSAMALLDRLAVAADAAGRMRTLIEAMVLQAVAHQRLRDAAAAHGRLDRALTLSDPEGSVRVFADEGAPMEGLLTAAIGRGVAVNYARRLLDALAKTDHRTGGGHGLVEPLSQRELEVLRLLATELSGPAIARELVVGVSTVRSHTKAIYAKLAVNSRRAAVRRGEELGLLTRASAG